MVPLRPRPALAALILALSAEAERRPRRPSST